MPPTHGAPPAQAMPQPPQLFASDDSSTHAAPHCEKPLLQTKVQTLATHCGRPFGTVGHTIEQLPHANGSVAVSTQRPPQHVVPGTHAGPRPQPIGRQTPPPHVSPAGQTWLQKPQLRGSLNVS
jgi:hypothetical protein